MPTNYLSELSTFARLAGALPGYLRQPLTREQARSRLAASLANREQNFLKVLQRGVYGNPASPYLAMLRKAGIEFGDVQSLIGKEGLEATLGTLYEAGVYATLDEVKGRRPVERPGLSLPVHASAFDNPLLTRHYEAMSSGSRGPRTRANIDLALLEHEAAYVSQYLDAFDLWNRPYVTWRPVPPVVTALKWVLRLAKVGKPLDRWFSQTRLTLAGEQWKFAFFTAVTFAEGRLMGHRFPWPRHVPVSDPAPVTDCLAAMKCSGSPAAIDTNVSSAVRICADAAARGADISGTLFRLGGEPLTSVKAKLIAAAGCRAICFYSITEISLVGAPCGDPDGDDNVHLLTDKLAALVRPKRLGAASVDALVYTTLLPSSPKLFINVESGDYANYSTRRCGCPLGELGFTHHLSGIRSYEKLTSEGVTFLGTELLRLIEEVLPASFGGSPNDYQFVEVEENGISRLLVLAGPRLGAIDEDAIIQKILQTLSRYPGGEAMVQHWRQGGTLRLVRKEPYQTASAKVLPLHLERLTSNK